MQVAVAVPFAVFKLTLVFYVAFVGKPTLFPGIFLHNVQKFAPAMRPSRLIDIPLIEQLRDIYLSIHFKCKNT